MGCVVVVVVPIDPPVEGRCWAFYVINDGALPIDKIVVESVHTEWGDFGNAEPIGIAYGGIAPGECLEVHREVDTELRTALALVVTVAGVAERVHAEFGRLYAPSQKKLVPIPILGKDGLLWERE